MTTPQEEWDKETVKAMIEAEVSLRMQEARQKWQDEMYRAVEAAKKAERERVVDQCEAAANYGKVMAKIEARNALLEELYEGISALESPYAIGQGGLVWSQMRAAALTLIRSKKTV